MEEGQAVTAVTQILWLVAFLVPITALVGYFVYDAYECGQSTDEGRVHAKRGHTPTPEQFREMREAAERQFGGLENIFAGAVRCDTLDGTKARKKNLTPYFLSLREKLLGSVVSGSEASVSLVGDPSFLDYRMRSGEMKVCSIFPVQFSDGKFGVVGHVDEGFSVLRPSASDCKIALENLSQMPRLEHDDGNINIWFTKERYVIASYNFSLQRWEPNGMGYGGAAACKKFEEHGITFDASST